MWNRSGQIDFLRHKPPHSSFLGRGIKRGLENQKYGFGRERKGGKHVGNVLIKDKQGFQNKVVDGTVQIKKTKRGPVSHIPTLQQGFCYALAIIKGAFGNKTLFNK